MNPIDFKRHRFPPAVILRAVRWYFRFTLSFRDVEELLAQRGIEVSYETVRCWTLKFGRLFAHNLRRSRPKPTGRWHLDEMVVKIGGKRMFLWRAVDDEGEVLDMAEKPGAKGRVIDINLLYITLREAGEAGEQDRLLQIPNALIFQRVVRRWPAGGIVS